MCVISQDTYTRHACTFSDPRGRYEKTVVRFSRALSGMSDSQMQGRNRELDTQPTVSGDEQFSYLSNWTTIPENLKLTCCQESLNGRYLVTS